MVRMLVLHLLMKMVYLTEEGNAPGSADRSVLGLLLWDTSGVDDTVALGTDDSTLTGKAPGVSDGIELGITEGFHRGTYIGADKSYHVGMTGIVFLLSYTGSIILIKTVVTSV